MIFAETVTHAIKACLPYSILRPGKSLALNTCFHNWSGLVYPSKFKRHRQVACPAPGLANNELAVNVLHDYFWVFIVMILTCPQIGRCIL